MQHASPGERIVQLEAELIAKDQQLGSLLAESTAKDARIAALEQQVADLAKQVAQLSEQLGKNSRNSHLPPSSETPDERRKRRNKAKKGKQGRKRGAQAGHQGTHRELLPAEKDRTRALYVEGKIVANSTKSTLQPLYGALQGILVSDRAKALNFWAMERRQICFAHLLRKFISFAERDGPAATFGRQLLDYTGLIFEYWHDYKAGKLSREMFVAWMAPVRRQFEAALAQTVSANIAGVSGSCADILEHQAALWTFVDQPGVEPTNNHAEREIRAFVLWRKRSFGAQSARGNRFAENLMTIAHTARKQKRNVLAFLTECCKAARNKGCSPSLFDAAAA